MIIAVNTRFLLRGKMEGLGWHNYELLRRLVRLRPRDQFLFLFDRPFDPAYVFAENVKPLIVRPPARHPILWYLWFEWSVPYVLRKHKADLFLSPDSYCSLRTRVPTLLITHDIAHVHYPDQIPGLVRRYYDYFVPRFLQKADHILTVSQAVRRDIHQQYGVAPEKMTVAHNGLRGSFAPLPAERIRTVRQKYADGQPFFFYLGAVHPRKNVARLIRAFSVFKERTSAPVKLVIAGRLAWKTESVQEAWTSSVYQRDITLLGYLSDDELSAVLGAALALTYVSLFEGFGLPVLEAMHAEVPVITSDRSSMPEVAGKAALLVDPEDELAIAEAMVRLWEDPALRAKCIAAGRLQRDRFSWDRTAELVSAMIGQWDPQARSD